MKKITTEPTVVARYTQFIMIPDFVHAMMPQMKSSALAVYVELAWIAGSDPTCYPSIAHLSRATGLTDRTIQQSLKSLVDLGLIEIKRRHRPNGSNQSNIYILLDVAKSDISAGEGVKIAPTLPKNSTPLEPYTSNHTTQDTLEYSPHDIVQWWMDRHHMKTIANSLVEHVQAKLLIKAGLQPGEEEKLYDWIASDDYWKDIPITLAIMYRQYNKWRVAGSPARARSYVPDV